MGEAETGEAVSPTVSPPEGKRVPHDRPRIGTGHHYVIALAWDGPHCSPDESPEPVSWMGLEDPELAFDNGLIGQDDNQREVQTTTAARTEADPPPTRKTN
jgi:hypothetical protein